MIEFLIDGRLDSKEYVTPSNKLDLTIGRHRFFNI